MDAGHDRWEHISHGFQVSTMLQTTRRFRSTSRPASRTCRGPTAGRSRTVRRLAELRRAGRDLIPRNAGIGSDFFSLNLRVSRAFRIAGGVKSKGSSKPST